MNPPGKQSILTFGGIASGSHYGYLYEHELFQNFDQLSNRDLYMVKLNDFQLNGKSITTDLYKYKYAVIDSLAPDIYLDQTDYATFIKNLVQSESLVCSSSSCYYKD